MFPHVLRLSDFETPICRFFAASRRAVTSRRPLFTWPCGAVRRRADRRPADPFLLGADLKGEATRASPYLRRGAVRRPADPPTRFSWGLTSKARPRGKPRLRRSFALPAPWRGTPTRRPADPPTRFSWGVDLKGEATRKAPAQTELRPTCAVARYADPPSRRPADPFLLGVDLKGEAMRKAPAQTELRPTCAVAARHAMTLLGHVVRRPADPPTRRPVPAGSDGASPYPYLPDLPRASLKKTGSHAGSRRWSSISDGEVG